MPSMPFRKQQIQDSSHFDENMKKSDVACLMSNLVWPAWWDLMSNGHCRISSMTEKSHAWLLHHHSSNSSVWNEHQTNVDHEHQIVAKILRHSLVHLPNFHYYLHEIASTSIDGYRFKMFQTSIGVNNIWYFGRGSSSILQSLSDGCHAQNLQTNLRNVLHINNLKQIECSPTNPTHWAKQCIFQGASSAWSCASFTVLKQQTICMQTPHRLPTVESNLQKHGRKQSTWETSGNIL